jgi:hypothetical protein
MVRSIPLPINIGESDYCDGNERELAVAGNVAVTTTIGWLFLREPLAAKTTSDCLACPYFHVGAFQCGSKVIVSPLGKVVGHPPAADNEK